MSRPFFTVPIATQRRVDRLRDAARSMIEQASERRICFGESYQFESGELLEYLAVPTIELQ